MLQLEPMPALERRWIHLALRDNPDVATQSIGEEPHRRVVILRRQTSRAEQAATRPPESGRPRDWSHRRGAHQKARHRRRRQGGAVRLPECGPGPSGMHTDSNVPCPTIGHQPIPDLIARIMPRMTSRTDSLRQFVAAPRYPWHRAAFTFALTSGHRAVRRGVRGRLCAHARGRYLPGVEVAGVDVAGLSRAPPPPRSATRCPACRAVS